MFRHPLTLAELKSLFGGRPARDFFSFKSPSFRKLGLDPDALKEAQMLSMMADEPRLIRRPLVLIHDHRGARVIVGNDAAAFAEVFA